MDTRTKKDGGIAVDMTRQEAADLEDALLHLLRLYVRYGDNEARMLSTGQQDAVNALRKALDNELRTPVPTKRRQRHRVEVTEGTFSGALFTTTAKVKARVFDDHDEATRFVENTANALQPRANRSGHAFRVALQLVEERPLRVIAEAGSRYVRPVAT